MKTEQVFKDNSLSDFLEKRLHSRFNRTRRLHNDFWYIWVKSGLLDFVCLKLRKNYQIPIQNEKTDYISGEVSMGNDSMTLDTHIYYDKWNDKEKFKKELESIIVQLRLHHSTYWSLFDKIFYNKRLKVKEKWEGYDTEAVFGFTVPVDEEFPMVGFTKGEIKEIREMIFPNSKKKAKTVLTIKQKRDLTDWCDGLERNIRIWKDKRVVYLVIEQMKHYKIPVDGFDDNYDLSEIRMTSERCSAIVSGKLAADEVLNAVTFRKMSQRLYKAFPILQEYIVQG